jgi:hypothetical protein
MNRCALLSAIICLGAACVAYAGSERFSSKELKQAIEPAPCLEWYADNEWNVSVWGTYAFSDNNDIREFDNFFLRNGASFSVDQGPFFSGDRYLETDHAWGGGVDVKYFFHRYFGLGVEGFVVEASRDGIDYEQELFGPLVRKKFEDDRAIGSFLGTFTLRYPFHCSRFSPYAWAGGGAILNGGESDIVTVDRPFPGVLSQTVTTERSNRHTEGMGQFGGGLEVRFTRHIGWLSDFSWNVVNGPNNNFGMVRSGLNFAF